MADQLRHPNISGYLEEQDELSDALRRFRVTIPGIIARRTQLTELLKTRTVQVPAYVGDPWEYHPNAPEPDQPTFSPAAPHSDIEVRLQIIDEYLWLYEKIQLKQIVQPYYSGRGTTPPELKLLL